MLEITLNQCQVQIGAAGESRLLIFVDPKSGITIKVPLDPVGAKELAQALGSRIAIPGSAAVRTLTKGNGQ